MKLIVTEKDSAARKIAEILGGKPSVKEHGRGRQKVKSYHFTYEGDDAVAIGLRGHVMETVFPNTYKRWSLKYLGDMIEKPDLAWIVDGGAAGTIAALRTVAKGATEVVIATDYDREGELIGHEALEILRGDALKRNPGDKPEKKKRAKAAAKDGAEARAKAPAPEPLAATRTSRPCCRRPWSTGTSACATRRSRRRRSRPRSTSPPPSTSTSPRRRTRARTSTSSGARCSRASCRSPRIATAPTTSRWAACSRRPCASSSTASSSGAPSSPVPYWEIKATLERDGEPFEVAHAKGRFDTRGGHAGGLRRRRRGARRGHRLRGQAAPGQAAGAVQHHGAHERRLRRGHDAGARHARRRVAVPRRPHQLPAHRQHRVPAVARPARQPAGARALAAGGRHGGPARRPGQAHAHARQEAHHRPPADLPGGRAQEGAAAATRPRSTTWSPGASSPRCCRRPSSRASAWTSSSAASRSWRTAAASPRWATSRSTRSTPPSATARCRRWSPATTLKVLDLRSEAKETQPPGRYGQGRLSRRWRSSGWAPRPPAPTSSSTSTTATTCATTPSSPPSWAWRSSPRSTPPWSRRRSTSRPAR